MTIHFGQIYKLEKIRPFLNLYNYKALRVLPAIHQQNRDDLSVVGWGAPLENTIAVSLLMDKWLLLNKSNDTEKAGTELSVLKQRWLPKWDVFVMTDEHQSQLKQLGRQAFLEYFLPNFLRKKVRKPKPVMPDNRVLQPA